MTAEQMGKLFQGMFTDHEAETGATVFTHRSVS